MLPDDLDGKLAARHTEVLADGVCDACVLLFWERHRPTQQQSKEWMARQQRKVDGGLGGARPHRRRSRTTSSATASA